MEGVLSRTLAVTDTLKEILSGVSEQEIEAVLQELLRVKRENKKVYTIAAGRANLIMAHFRHAAYADRIPLLCGF